MFTIKTKLKFLKAQIKVAFTKKRYLGNHPKTKKCVTVVFLLTVIAYVAFNLSLQLPEFEIKLNGGFTVENVLKTKIEAIQEIPVEEESKPMSIEEAVRSIFPEHPDIALALAKAESGLNPKMHSTTDRMRDGRAFSIGLLQTNLTVHKIGGKDCTKAFVGRDYKAVVVNEDLYAECVKLAMNPEINLKEARAIYDRSGGFNPWGAYTSGAYKNKL